MPLFHAAKVRKLRFSSRDSSQENILLWHLFYGIDLHTTGFDVMRLCNRAQAAL